LREYDFAAYCSGEATRWGGDQVTPYQANVPVVLNRVEFHPGQYVFADDSGAVAVPGAEIGAVLEMVRTVQLEDSAFRTQIAAEKLTVAPGGRDQENTNNV
jgi:regulator of RNase E activity RraA